MRNPDTSQCQITVYDPNKKPMKEIETIMRGPSPTLSQFYYICPSPDLRNLLPDCGSHKRRRATDNMNLRLKFDNWEKSLVDSITVFRAPVILPNQERVENFAIFGNLVENSNRTYRSEI